MTIVAGGPRPRRDPRLIELPIELLRYATGIGRTRLVHAVEAGLVDSFNENSEKSHVMGACGEAAFCWAYGIPWPERVDTFDKLPDLDPNWEIRTTSSLDFLKVRKKPKDKANSRVTFVLKRGENLWHVLTRYIRAGDAQKKYPPRDPGNRNRPAHFVPLRDLLPITDIEHSSHAWWPVAGEPGRWECFFGHEIWATEAPIYEWPHPIELVRRAKA